MVTVRQGGGHCYGAEGKGHRYDDKLHDGNQGRYHGSKHQQTECTLGITYEGKNPMQ